MHFPLYPPPPLTQEICHRLVEEETKCPLHQTQIQLLLPLTHVSEFGFWEHRVSSPPRRREGSLRGTDSSASLGALHPGQTSSGPSTARRDLGHKVTPTLGQPELADESLSHPKCQGTTSRSPMTQDLSPAARAEGTHLYPSSCLC